MGALRLGHVLVGVSSRRSEVSQRYQSLATPYHRLPAKQVTGNPLNLPSGGYTTPETVIIFSFSRAGGRDAQNWAPTPVEG